MHAPISAADDTLTFPGAQDLVQRLSADTEQTGQLTLGDSPQQARIIEQQRGDHALQRLRSFDHQSLRVLANDCDQAGQDASANGARCRELGRE